MSNLVFVLGAGASMHMGAPGMGRFFEKADQLSDEFHDDVTCRIEREQVNRAMCKLQDAHSKANIELSNLESVMSAFEMADLLRIAPSDENGTLVVAIKRLIAWTLDHSMLYAFKDGSIVTTETYRHFAEMIARLSRQQSPKHICTVVTFNYDLALDLALHSAGVTPNIGFDPSVSGRVNLLKLHGSLGWHECGNSTCGKIATLALPRLERHYETVPMTWSKLSTYLTNGALPPRCQKCNSQLSNDVVIIPPSWNKGQYRTELANVWRTAAQELGRATDIIVCGYSFPQTDSFFRDLYGLSTIGSPPLKTFWVIDPNKEVESRYHEMLGPGTRPNFKFLQCPFETGVGFIENRFRRP